MLSITTSWDDGDVLDIKLASLLDRYGIKGTFYISQNYRENRLTDDAVRALSQRHEIGAHTLTHPNLPKVSHEQKVREVVGSKQWLEGVIGKEVPMFCYPIGRLDAETEKVVRDAKFCGARTTVQGNIRPVNNAYQLPTTLHVYPMPFRKSGPYTYVWTRLLDPVIERGQMFRDLGVPWFAFRSWGALARSTFDIAHRNGLVFHLWGHSWEIEKFGMWNELESVLKYIGNRSDCRYVTNSDLI